MNNATPWIEKYRVVDLSKMIFELYNKKILDNIINGDANIFPNLLFHGFPGTGKTSATIASLNEFQKRHNQINNGLVLSFNASDDRSVDVIRTNISQFVNSNNLFNKGTKFIVLDVADSMTKQSQQALKSLLQECPKNVRFCLICNYISKIDPSLQNEFIKLRFNQLPTEDIIIFLRNIVRSEKLNMNDDSLRSIQKLYKYDIRSMINFMQSNQSILQKKTKQTLNEIFYIIDETVWENLYKIAKTTEPTENMLTMIRQISITYNIDKKNIIKDFLNYIIRNKCELVSSKFLSFVENLMHFQDCKNAYYINYAISQLLLFISETNKEEISL